jgi:hypothetical protein
MIDRIFVEFGVVLVPLEAVQSYSYQFPAAGNTNVTDAEIRDLAR